MCFDSGTGPQERRSNLKDGTSERELVNRFVDVVRRPVDTHIRHCHGRHVDQTVVDVYEAEPEIIDQRGEKRCVSFTLKSVRARECRKEKFKSVALMLLASVPPSEAAGHQLRTEALIRNPRKRTVPRSCPARRGTPGPIGGELVVGILPGLLTISGALFKVTWQVSH